MEVAESISRGRTETNHDSGGLRPVDEREKRSAVLIEPDLSFIGRIMRLEGNAFKKCFQCGTCSAACPLSPAEDPFPRKEMAWAVWGMREELLADPDIWLCHNCNDCSIRCPRGGRPGDVLAAVRQECIAHNSVPGFLARWVQNPRYIPFLFGIPALFLGLAVLSKDRMAEGLGFLPAAGSQIVYPYSPAIPHWLINLFFGIFGILVLVAIVAGIVRFWRSLKLAHPRVGNAPEKGLLSSLGSTLRSIIFHEHFSLCGATQNRRLAHLSVFFGFVALTIVTLCVITGTLNPLLPDFVYPFSFWNPWKVLANVGGLALLTGLLLIIRDRLNNSANIGTSNYSDWSFVGLLIMVTLSGFLTELLHYLRMVPHRHVVYFIHLVLVFALLMYLPYSKFAHAIYRTVAMVFAEYSGRKIGVTKGTDGLQPAIGQIDSRREGLDGV